MALPQARLHLAQRYLDRLVDDPHMKCCNSQCRQGRDCPHRKPLSDEATQRLFKAIGFIVAGVILGITISKYSAAKAYELGYAKALQNLEKEAEIRWAHFQENRKQSCLSWWFNDSAARIRDAQVFMCQNKRKWK